MQRTITSSAIQFKGSGWYATDYGGKSAGGDSAKDSRTEAKESKEAAPPKESKKETPAKK